MIPRILIVALLFGPMAMAQDTTSCAHLLDLGFLREQRTVSVPIETMAVTIESTQTVEGQQIAFSAYSVFDFSAERMYQSTSYGGEPTMVLRFQNGRATMEVPGTGAQLPAPPQLVTQLEDAYQQMLEVGPTDPTAFYGEAEIVSCDGPVAYGDVLAGEQATVRTFGGAALMHEIRSGAPVRAVFSDGGLSGVVADASELGEIIGVFDEVRVDSDGHLERLATRQYRWDGTKPELMGTTTMTYDVNLVVDASLFAP